MVRQKQTTPGKRYINLAYITGFGCILVGVLVACFNGNLWPLAGIVLVAGSLLTELMLHRK